MNISNLKDYFRGWIIGDFENSILRTKDFEVGILTHLKDEVWPSHYHKEATEYNVLVKGKMIANGKELNTGDVFIFEKGEIANPIFLEDCKLVIIKTPSSTSDKYEI